MVRSRTPKFDASEVITNEIIRIIERGVLPWRKPWTAGGGSRPLRVGGEPYQGVNNFLLTMRTVIAGHSSPFWMTIPQANALGAKVRKPVACDRLVIGDGGEHRDVKLVQVNNLLANIRCRPDRRCVGCTGAQHPGARDAGNFIGSFRQFHGEIFDQQINRRPLPHHARQVFSRYR